MPAEKAPQIAITPRDLTTQAAVSEEPEDVINKSTETVETKMAFVSVEDPTELMTAVPDPESKHDTLMGFSQEVSTKIEFSIPESPAEPVSIPCEPLTTEDHSIPEHLELGAEAAICDVAALTIKNKGVSGQDESDQ
ncbi:hypothetical protein Q7C36_010145 [Tachysurus vachellii]|uniref:Uncharacterized protein n=1 Tax=Tachysurus vachellii TaxID=175792 RepID=A0AA88MZA2_TACVA|nr:hypothetical protein Q7C36_010145 [Tachysurus vachellii]